MNPTPTLLPSGLADVLPPLAAAEFRLVHHFLKTFMAFGYQPVIPPLAEYADSLLAGQGEATSHHVFKMPDPLAPEMLALRADMTGQVARIAGGALAAMARPLRLCYAGYTLRTAPEALKTRRQHTQVGIERFGDMDAPSVAEVLAISAHALENNGVDGLTIDLHYPSVLEALLKRYPESRHAAIRDAVRLKDHARLHALEALDIAEMMRHAGSAAGVLQRLSASNLPEVANAAADLAALVTALEAARVNASLTIDLLDLSGYGYYTGVGYAMFWNKAGLEVGRGGCYATRNGEDAVGFTLYINDVLDHLPTEAAAPTRTIPHGTPAAEAAKLQAEGFVTVFGS
ncbi:MAG: ATP phosphoribosyltransferase regulatory subunit [Alphaproteobacteria bacterium]|nr:ATP phosphoribosyltransferase regulatory subunit [Alphaproteobacteria bacterium]